MRKMMPAGPLMMEHRLIERMIAVMGDEAGRLEHGGRADPDFVDDIVDFIRTYADACHHGKEEDILFRELRKKPLSEQDALVMNELIADHVKGRTLTRTMVEANARFRAGEQGALETVIDCMKQLRAFYPRHIEKEDRHFFAPAMRYFTEEERQAMLEEGFEFDRRLFHRHYEETVSRAEERQTMRMAV